MNDRLIARHLLAASLVAVPVCAFATEFQLQAMMRLQQLIQSTRNGTLVPQGSDVNGCQLLTHLTYNQRQHTGNVFTDANCRAAFRMSVSIYFSASPTHGQAPLGVQFYATIGDQYSIDFGDGQTGSLTSTCNGTPNAHRPDARAEGACPPPGAYHTYTTQGTYRATLRLITNCRQEASCATSADYTVTITVLPPRETREWE
jgi:hypothetical protein